MITADRSDRPIVTKNDPEDWTENQQYNRYFRRSEPDYGGVDDGLGHIISDADPGL